MQDIREQLAQIMLENADPVGLLDELKRVFVLFGQSQELDAKVQEAYLAAALQIDYARSEFLRRGIR